MNHEPQVVRPLRGSSAVEAADNGCCASGADGPSTVAGSGSRANLLTAVWDDLGVSNMVRHSVIRFRHGIRRVR